MKVRTLIWKIISKRESRAVSEDWWLNTHLYVVSWNHMFTTYMHHFIGFPFSLLICSVNWPSSTVLQEKASLNFPSAHKKGDWTVLPFLKQSCTRWGRNSFTVYSIAYVPSDSAGGLSTDSQMGLRRPRGTCSLMRPRQAHKWLKHKVR